MNEEERYRLTTWGCMQAVLTAWNINTDHLTPRMGECMVEDFMEMLVKHGYLTKEEDE